MLSKKATLFCDKLDKLKINDLLSEIFYKLSNFNYYNGYCPKNIVLKKSDYEMIKKEKSHLIITKDNEDYILGMKIKVVTPNIFAKKLNFKERKKIQSLFPKLQKERNF